MKLEAVSSHEEARQLVLDLVKNVDNGIYGYRESGALEQQKNGTTYFGNLEIARDALNLAPSNTALKQIVSAGRELCVSFVVAGGRRHFSAPQRGDRVIKLDGTVVAEL